MITKELYKAKNISELSATDLAIVALEFMDENRYDHFGMVALMQGSEMTEKKNRRLVSNWFEWNVGDLYKLQTYYEWKYL